MSYGISLSEPLWAIPVILLGLPIVLGMGIASALPRRNAVDRPNRTAQWYGYTVCLIAVVVLLFSTVSIIDSLFTLSNPLHEAHGYGVSLTSFEAYRATYDEARPVPPAPADAARPAPPTEAELRTRYEALRADRIQTNRYEAQRSLVTSGLLTIFASVLFALHWRWLRRLGSGAAEGVLPSGARAVPQ